MKNLLVVLSFLVAGSSAFAGGAQAFRCQYAFEKNNWDRFTCILGQDKLVVALDKDENCTITALE